MLIESDKSEINFNEKDFLLTLLKSCPVAPFDVNWIKKSGSKTVIFKSGSILSSEDVEKWLSRPIDLEFTSSINESFMKEGFELFDDLFSIAKPGAFSFEEEDEWKKRFLNWVNQNFWKEEACISRLELACLVGKYFCELSEDFEDRFFKFPLEIQKRNIIRAAVAVLMALSLGYQDLIFLKDYYLVTLFMDYPFCEKTWSGLDQETLNNLLKNNCDETSMAAIKDLYQEKIGIGVDFLKAKLENQGLAKYLSWSFERFNGNGFLLNVKNSELNDLDAITILSHRICSFDDVDFSTPINIRIVLEKLKEESGHGHRLDQILSKLFLDLEGQDSGYLEIVGL